MLSRAALCAGALRPLVANQMTSRLALLSSSRGNTTLTQHIDNWERANKIYYGPDRDTKNFPLKPCPESAPPVRHGFLPLSLLQNFYEKTGVTGPYVFAFTLSTYLLSKEIWVVEHGFVEMFSFWGAFYIAQTRIAPGITQYIDEQIDALKKSRWEEPLEECKAVAQSTIDQATSLIQKEQAQKYIFEAKKENVDLQLEATYRQRLNEVHQTVKKRLDYHMDVENAKRSFQQDHMVNWIVRGVQSNITPQQEKDSIKQCIADLKALSTRQATA